VRWRDATCASAECIGGRVMDSDLANIGLICLLMGVGIVVFIGIIFVYLAVNEFLETWLLKD
jgi:hypothetical protein